jgi:ribosome assembly protein RRB1
MPRNPKKGGGKAGGGGKKKAAAPGGAAAAAAAKKALAAQQQQQQQQPRVWLPGAELDPEVDGDAADLELEYDPTAYDCLHRFQAEWPCLSLDLPRDALGGPRSAFPHELFVVAGTQADQPRGNCLALLRLTHLGQGRHGKRDAAGKRAARRREGEEGGGGGGGKKAAAAAAAAAGAGAMSEDDDEDDDDAFGDDEDDDEGDSEDDEDEDDGDGDEPPRMHARLVAQPHGTNRVRCAPQRPGLVAVWADTGVVRVLDVSPLLQEMAQDEHPKPKSASRVQVSLIPDFCLGFFERVFFSSFPRFEGATSFFWR